ncbi:MAG: hypothetical protein RL172_1712 [Bacteroidota bacterium]|jgi:hypothetical protein
MKKKPIAYCILLTVFLSAAAFAQQNNTDAASDGVAMDKGTWFSTLTFSLSTRRAENDNTIFVNYVSQKRNSWSVRGDGGFIFKKNVGVGMGFSYGQTRENNVVTASDGASTSNQLYSNNFTARPFVKNFIPLGEKNRLYIINQTEIQLSFEHSIRESVSNDILTRKYSNKQTYGIGFRPGLLLFIQKNFAFETTVDVFGLQRSIEKTTTTGQPDSKVVKSDADLKIDILKLAFGFSLYF